MIPAPKRFDIFSTLTEGCSEGLDIYVQKVPGLDAFRFYRLRFAISGHEGDRFKISIHAYSLHVRTVAATEGQHTEVVLSVLHNVCMYVCM